MMEVIQQWFDAHEAIVLGSYYGFLVGFLVGWVAMYLDCRAAIRRKRAKR